MDCMIDIETLSIKPNATILTIGAIKFNKSIQERPLKDMETFYIRINKNSCEKLKMDVDPKTIEWWKTQNDKTYYEAFENTDRIDIKEGLVQLSNFLKGHKNIWANSPNFDIVILENAYNCCKLDIPWNFWNLRDTRTVYDLASVRLNDFFNKDEHHNALNDCHSQIKALKQSFKNLGLYTVNKKIKL